MHGCRVYDEKKGDEVKPASEMSDLNPDEVRIINALERNRIDRGLAACNDLHIEVHSEPMAAQLLNGLPLSALTPNVIRSLDIHTR